MNTKRDEVVRFLDKDLLPQVQDAFMGPFRNEPGWHKRQDAKGLLSQTRFAMLLLREVGSDSSKRMSRLTILAFINTSSVLGDCIDTLMICVS